MDSCRKGVCFARFIPHNAYEIRHIFRLPRAASTRYPWRQHSTEGQPRGVVPRIKTRGSGTMAHMHGTIYMAHEMHVEKAE